MVNKVFRYLLTLTGLILGFILSRSLSEIDAIKELAAGKAGDLSIIIGIIIGTLLTGIIFYFLAPYLIRLILKISDVIENGLQKFPTMDILVGIGGLIIVLIVTNLLLSPLIKLMAGQSDTLVMVALILILAANITVGIIGVKFTMKRKDDIYSFFSLTKKFGKDKKNKGENRAGISQPKILDTSVIIDGRIFDICKTGFVEGPIIIPSFVLEELRHIADSSDSLKRARGRRGLDILNQIQKELPIVVEISERDFPNIAEVDSKLLKLAQVMSGKVITNDFNLNKVAEFQGVPVLNINELANAVKPVVIPGEEMQLTIIKDGKESGQGVAYLDDGTMIVIEGGKKHVGEHVEVIVTSVLQTAAGRMIFARIKSVQEKVVI